MFKKIEWVSFDDVNVNFFDVSSLHSLQELWFISEILRRHEPERIVEYGTAYGGLTRLLGRWAFLVDSKVLTIDNESHFTVSGWEKSLSMLAELPVEKLNANEYAQETYEKIQEFAKNYKTLFYCDGGNKPLEMKSCVKIMKDDDLVVCHDFFPSQEVLDKYIITLPEPVKSVSYILPYQVERLLKSENVTTVFEEQLEGRNKDESSKFRLLALRKKKRNGSDK